MRKWITNRFGTLGACVAVAIYLVAATYLWVCFVKLCQWLGQFTWP